MRIVFSFVFLFALAGCGYFTNPGAMPTGYTYHGEPYNARPGPEAPKLKSAVICSSGTCEMQTKEDCDSVCDMGCSGVCEMSGAKDCGAECDMDCDDSCAGACDSGTCDKAMTPTPGAPQNLLGRTAGSSL